MMRPRFLRAPALALASALAACEGVYLTAPPDSSIDLTANPEFVAAHGGTSEITAFVIEPAGTYVPDGTVVRWTTDLGRIDPETRTRRGAAQARFVSDARSGVAHIRAFSGSVSAEPLDITVGNARVTAIRIRADPSRITTGNSTTVTATVVGESGNPIPNVPVVFEIADDNDRATDSFASAGAPVFTDNNGEASDILRTRRNTVGVADVQARAPDGEGGFVTSQVLRIPIL